MGNDFYEELKGLVGQEDAPRVALDEVCGPMIVRAPILTPPSITAV